MERALRNGEMVTMPFWGLAEVKDVSRSWELGSEWDFYHIRPLHLQGAIRIPEPNLAEMGIRPILSRREMSEIIFLRPIPQGVRHLRQPGGYRQWIELLRSGTPGVHPWILRQMRRADKPLGPKESELRENHPAKFSRGNSRGLRLLAAAGRHLRSQSSGLKE